METKSPWVWFGQSLVKLLSFPEIPELWPPLNLNQHTASPNRLTQGKTFSDLLSCHCPPHPPPPPFPLFSKSGFLSSPVYSPLKGSPLLWNLERLQILQLELPPYSSSLFSPLDIILSNKSFLTQVPVYGFVFVLDLSLTFVFGVLFWFGFFWYIGAL